MIDLNNLKEIKKLDPKDVYGSTELFLQQCEQIWEDTKKIKFEERIKNAGNIIVCGMGGSAYGSYVVQSLFKDNINIPIISNNDYTLPAFASEKSLIILSSYSGTTEESLSCGKEAKEKGFTITGMTNGGPLAEFLKSNNIPALVFDPKNNPSGQPRLGTGYMVLGFIALLTQLEYLHVSDEDVKTALSEIKEGLPRIKTKAQEIAKALQGYFPVIFSAEFLNGNAHILRNQFNETSKTFSAFEDIPELNHHLMEGFKYPEGNKMKVFLLNSQMYSDLHKKRIALTKDVVEKNSYEALEYIPNGSTPLSQVLNTLAFGGYLTVYLGLLYGQDPSLIPWVDYFKAQLKK